MIKECFKCLVLFIERACLVIAVESRVVFACFFKGCKQVGKVCFDFSLLCFVVCVDKDVIIVVFACSTFCVFAIVVCTNCHSKVVAVFEGQIVTCCRDDVFFVRKSTYA